MSHFRIVHGSRTHIRGLCERDNPRQRAFISLNKEEVGMTPVSDHRQFAIVGVSREIVG